MWKLPLEKYALKPDHPFEEDYASCQMAIIPENFFEEADKGMIRFKKTPKWCFCDEGIGFEDGTTLEADVVILATGYDGDKKLKAIIPEPFPSWLEFPWGLMPLYRYLIKISYTFLNEKKEKNNTVSETLIRWCMYNSSIYIILILMLI